MIKRRYMRTRQLKPGMIIDQVIKDPTGRNLVVQGSAIDDYIISSLLKLGIMSVYIREGNADPDDPDAILIAEFQKVLTIGIMRGADMVHAEFLHQFQPLLDGTRIGGSTQGTEGMMVGILGSHRLSR